MLGNLHKAMLSHNIGHWPSIRAIILLVLTGLALWLEIQHTASDTEM
jgi:hypothetical protein